MPSCLGLYIENNLIKYAKVSKNNDAIKVESFGMKFYDDLGKTIKQIIEETYSFKLPISVNLVGETYNRFEVFSLLSKKDVEGMIKTEFENLCYDRELNPGVYEQRHIISDTKMQNDKVKVVHVSTQKSAIAQRKNELSEYRITNMSPIGMSIINLLKKDKTSNALIVNIEKDTTVTRISNNSISSVDIIPIGAQNIIENINKKENSYSKAYEICKNSTIYTENDTDLQYEENEYLVDIMPILFQIVSEVRKMIDESLESVEKVYITGTASAINNIDIYFQEYLKNVTCEILKPVFINGNSKINIKDYIEVNSAIAMALQGLEKENNINFINESATTKVFKLLKTNVSTINVNKVTTSDINKIIDRFSRQYNIVFFTFIMLVILYFTGSFYINQQIEEKLGIAENNINIANDRIKKIEDYNNKFQNQIGNYDKLIRNIENINDANSRDKRFKNTIPNLLNNIMAIIPKGVQLISIENTSDTHIIINAKSPKYEQIAFFKTKLKTEEILKKVISDTGTMQGGELSVSIEGELP